jgi:dipeptidyl aminopeptidase/acylaminoacyl peptidase
VQCDDDVSDSVAIYVAQGEESAASIDPAARAEVKEVIHVLQRKNQERRIGDRGIPRGRLAYFQLDAVLTKAETPEYELSPRFSPDGKQLVYAAGVPGDRADHLFVRPVAGGPARQLTRADANDCHPSFSPDGSMIVFARDKTYVWGGLASNWSNGGVICVVGINGSNERQLTADDGDDFQPEFSGDGKTIIFSTRHGRASIPVDGSAAITANVGCQPPRLFHGKSEIDHREVRRIGPECDDHHRLSRGWMAEQTFGYGEVFNRLSWHVSVARWTS